MSRPGPRVVELAEYEPRRLARSELPADIGETLWRYYGSQVAVEFPSPKTGDRWELTLLGWAGTIPLTPEYHFSLRPRTPLTNLFGMLEYAYGLKSFYLLPGLTKCDSIEGFYERLAGLLAGRVLERSRQGLYRAYLDRTERLPYLRGRLEPAGSHSRPGQVRLTCHYRESTVDIEDNQILLWALRTIAGSGLGSARVLPAVRRAYRALQGVVSLTPFPPRACTGRSYNRLNEDYRLLHALCRFFLEGSGPGHVQGDRTMVPFLVNMARLYERFVAEWLRVHLPPGLVLERQARVGLTGGEDLHFDIDLVLYQAGRAKWVLDTKYKTESGPSTADIAQVVAYAQAKGCREAVLVYPARPARPLDSQVGDIRVRSLTFALDGDLEAGGRSFLQALLADQDHRF